MFYVYILWWRAFTFSLSMDYILILIFLFFNLMLFTIECLQRFLSTFEVRGGCVIRAVFYLAMSCCGGARDLVLLFCVFNDGLYAVFYNLIMGV